MRTKGRQHYYDEVTILFNLLEWKHLIERLAPRERKTRRSAASFPSYRQNAVPVSRRPAVREALRGSYNSSGGCKGVWG